MRTSGVPLFGRNEQLLQKELSQAIESLAVFQCNEVCLIIRNFRLFHALYLREISDVR